MAFSGMKAAMGGVIGIPIVDGIMRDHVKSVADAQYQLQFLTNIQKGSYQELLKQELQSYIKRQEAAKLDREEKQKQIELAKQLALAEKGRGEIPQKEAEIESLRNKLKNAYGEERQQIVDAIALRQQELAILVGFGIAAKTGLKAISKGGKSKGVSGGNMTSYSGGGAVAGYSGAMATTSAMNINVTGRISGSDIVLSYDKTKDNKSR